MHLIGAPTRGTPSLVRPVITWAPLRSASPLCVNDDGLGFLDSFLEEENGVEPSSSPPSSAPPLAEAPEPPNVDVTDAEASPSPMTTAIGEDTVLSDSTTSLPLLHRPLPQMALCALGYAVHVCVLSRHSIPLGGMALGCDTVVGLGVLVAAGLHRSRQQKSAVPPWLTGKACEEAAEMADFGGAPSRERLKLLATCVLALGAPLLFSFAGSLIDVLLSVLVIAGLPLNKTRLMSARLLLEQVLLNLGVFQMIRTRHPGFFSRVWVRWSLRGPWLAPVLGGYAASLALFNLVEPLNQALLPGLNYKPEGMVAQLANPADKSVVSLALAAIAPCLGAPLFEELQSRAFILQALTAVAPISGALVLSGLIFGMQHFQLGLVLPLSVTGFCWGVLYVNSRNLFVPMAVHALWSDVTGAHTSEHAKCPLLMPHLHPPERWRL